MENTVSGDFFTFQLYNAPAHRNTPDFISPLLWPPISPDLNPVDYELRGL